MGYPIQPERSENTGRRVGRPAPQKRIHARQQFSRPEGLNNVVVGTQVQAEHDILFLTLGGEHEHRHGHALLSQAATDLVAVHLRQHDVEQNQIRVLLKGRLEPGGAFDCRRDVESAGDKRIFQNPKQNRIVLDNQNSGRTHGRLIIGRAMENVLPSPGRLATVTAPPCAPTMYFTMLKPRPHPPVSLDNDWST